MVIPRSVQAVFFDLNGTLVRDRVVHQAAFQEIFSARGISLTPEEYEQKVANRLNREIWPAVLGTSLEETEVQKLSQDKEKRYNTLLGTYGVAVPGAKELMQGLKESGRYIGLVTSAPPSVVERVMEFTGLDGFFDDVVNASVIHQGKPDPEAYMVALERSGYTAGNSLAFEDSPQGVRAAVAAGLGVVGVLPEYSEELLRMYGAQDVINDFTEVTLSVD